MQRRLLFVFVLLSSIGSLLRSQSTEEPPIPVVIICPYHEDSLRRAYESGLTSPAGGTMSIDSLGREVARSTGALTEQVERSFIYLYLLIGVLALISVAALRVAYRLRLEVQEVRDAQRPTTLALPSPVIVESSPLHRRTSPKRTHTQKRKPAEKARPTRRGGRSRA